MNRNSRILQFIISILLPLSGTALGGSLQVQCLDSEGNALEGAKVTATCLNCFVAPGSDLPSKDRISDSKGVADLGSLDNAVYRVYGRKDGFAPSLYEYVEMTGPRRDITLKFTAGSDRILHFENGFPMAEITNMQQQGKYLASSGKPLEAAKVYEQAIALNPSYMDLYYELAEIYLSQGKYDQGEALLHKILDLTSMLVKIYNPLVQPGHYQQLQGKASNALDRLSVTKAENALKVKDYDAAAAAFREAIEKYPVDLEMHARLAATLANAQKYDEAMQAIEVALRMAPGDKGLEDVKNQIITAKTKATLIQAQNTLNESDALMKAGDFEGALSKLHESLALVPENAQSPIWRRIGLAQAKLNRSADAVESFKKSIDLAPAEKRGDYVKQLFQYYLEEKNFEDALTLLCDPRITKPADREKILLMAAKQYANSLPQLSESALERTIRINPENLDAHFDLGQMYYGDGKDKDSRTRELLTRYSELGKDPEKLEKAKNMLLVVSERSPE